VIVIVRP